MTDIADLIKAAISVPVTVKITDMTAYGAGIGVDVYSNGDAGNTVITRHKVTQGVEAIVAAHLAARTPKTQKKTRKTEHRVHREIFGR